MNKFEALDNLVKPQLFPATFILVYQSVDKGIQDVIEMLFFKRRGTAKAQTLKD